MPLEEFPTSTAAPCRRERYSVDGRFVTSRAFDREKWMKDAQLLLDVSLKAYKLAKEKNVDGLSDLNDQLYEACVICHQDYRPNYRKRL